MNDPSTYVDVLVRRHVRLILRTLLRAADEKKIPHTSSGLLVTPNDDDLKRLEDIWIQAYWTALQGTAKDPFLVDQTPATLVSNAQEIADETVRLFWGGLYEMDQQTEAEATKP